MDFIGVVSFATHLALAGFLIWGFIRTRNSGYLVLLIPFTIWTFVIPPVTSGVIESGRFTVTGDLVAFLHFVSSILRTLIFLLGFYLLITRTPKASVSDGTPTAPRDDEADVPA